MHIIYLDKNIMLENIINEINLINIGEDIKYLNRNDGVLIKGFINIECEYLSLGVIKSFMDKVDVSILIPYENIITNELQFKLLDFDYLIKNNNLSLSFKVNIEGYKEIEKSFQDETEEMEIVSNVDVSLSKIKEIINNNDEIIELNDFSNIIDDNNENSNDNDKIEETDNNENDDIIDYNDNDEIKEENNLDDKIEMDLINKDEIKEENNIYNDDGKRLLFNITGNQEEQIENKKNKSFFDTIFKKEKKIKMWKYRVVLENENYEDIAKEYNVNLYKLKEINQNTLLEIGKIIKIPNYHE